MVHIVIRPELPLKGLNTNHSANNMEALANFDEFEEDDEEFLERDSLGRIRREFFPRIHPFERYRERKFLARFRLTRNIAACLSDDFGQSPFATRGWNLGGGLSHRDRFCLALRYYATGSFHSAIGDTQGVHKSTVSRAVHDVTEYLYVNRDKYIKFPRRQDFPICAQDFEALHGFPSVIGCVDGTHVAIEAPKEHEKIYVNRHWFHSLNVMAICDPFLRFTFVDSRFPGSSHDSYVFRRSSIAAIGEDDILEGYWLLGDSGYPLKRYMMTPVLHPQHPSEVVYNTDHSHTRGRIEMAFGVLKRRFRCLDESGGVILAHPLHAAKIVIACAILHNIAVTHNLMILLDNDWDRFQRPQRRQEREEEEEEDVFGPDEDELENGNRPGARLRQRLIQLRFQVDENGQRIN